MNVTTVTLKVDSYQTQNTVLFNGKTVQGRNKTQNCRHKAILDCVDDFFDSVHNELNDSFYLCVCGNPFEQALLRLEANARKTVSGFSVGTQSFEWSTAARLQYLQERLGAATREKTIPVCLTGNVSVSLPSYPLIKLATASTTPKLIVSDSLYEIKGWLEDEECEPVAFLVGGESQKAGNTYIIGCTEANVPEMVQAYLETRYINPCIKKILSESGIDYDTHSDSKLILATRTEPYFYMDADSNDVRLFCEDRFTLGVHSVSLDANGDVICDRLDDLAKLHYTVDDNPVGDAAASVVVQDAFDFRQITAEAEGTCKLDFFFEDSISLFTAFVTAKPHNYIRTIQSEIQSKGKAVSRWRLNHPYDIVTTFEPADAEDDDDIEYISSDTDVAEIRGKQIIIRDNGKFTLTTKTSQLSVKQSYTVENAVVESVRLGAWPHDGKLRIGARFQTEVILEPQEANWTGFDVHILKGRECFSVSYLPDSRVEIVAKKQGDCSVEFVARDNPDERYVQEFKIVKVTKPQRFTEYGKWLFVPSILAAIIVTYPIKYLSILAACVATLLCLIGSIRNERNAKKILCTATPLFVLVWLLHTFFFGGVYQTLDKLPEDALADMLENIEGDVSDSTYYDSDNIRELKVQNESIEYLGYYLCYCDNLIFDENSMYFVFSADYVNPGTENAYTLYIVGQYDMVRYVLGCGTEYEELILSYYESFDDALRHIPDADETNLSDADEYKIWQGNHVLSEKDITDKNMKKLVDACLAENKNLDLTYYTAWLYVSDAIEASNHNCLYLCFKENIENEDGTSDTLYRSYRIDNLQIVDDELNLTSIVFRTVPPSQDFSDSIDHDLADGVKLYYHHRTSDSSSIDSAG